MVIANPIYDVVFKRMMENERVAKFFIGTLLEEIIETVAVKPQEFTYSDELSALAVFRLDFIATIKTKTGEQKKILIEIQKAKNQIDLMRFRKYLAEQYKKEDTVDNKKVILPITTIYILGFKLNEIETPCLKVARNYVDHVNKLSIETKSDFVEKLTHDSYIVQVDRITNRYQTTLDKLLSIFEQSNFVDENKITKEFNHKVDFEDMRLTTEILHYAGTNPEEKKKIEIEQEAWRTVDAMTGDLREKLALQNSLLTEKESEISAKDIAISEKDQAILDLQKEMEELKKQIRDDR